MFIEYLEDLRQKPKEVRVRYAILFSSMVTGVVIVIWLTGLFLTNYGKRNTEDVAETDVAQEEKTTAELFDAANPFKDGTSGSFQESQNVWVQDLRTFETDELETVSPRPTPQEIPRKATSTLQ